MTKQQHIMCAIEAWRRAYPGTYPRTTTVADLLVQHGVFEHPKACMSRILKLRQAGLLGPPTSETRSRKWDGGGLRVTPLGREAMGL